jgi:C4-dicarboxylate-specific signal transduction histidine kinase
VADLYWTASASRRWQLAATAHSWRNSAREGAIDPPHGVDVQQRAGTLAREQQEELAHLARVAALGELSGAFAHELAQPLTAILANAEAALQLAMRESATPPELAEMLRDIIKDDVRAAAMIERLHALLARREIRRQSVDLNQTIGDVLALVRSDLIARNVSVRLELAPQPLNVLADAVQLQQVLLNLVVNACEAMSATPPAERQLTITTGAAEHGRKIACSVTDRGHGIQQPCLDEIFEPFVTTKSNGLGLGLPICRSILEAHGGRLWAQNTSEGGATFHFLI